MLNDCVLEWLRVRQRKKKQKTIVRPTYLIRINRTSVDRGEKKSQTGLRHINSLRIKSSARDDRGMGGRTSDRARARTYTRCWVIPLMYLLPDYSMRLRLFTRIALVSIEICIFFFHSRLQLCLTFSFLFSLSHCS